MALCACGCGRNTPLAKRTTKYGKKGEPRKYFPGHYAGSLGYDQRYGQTNRERISAYRRDWRARTKLEALVHYGGDPPRCDCCGEQHIEFLNLDHINGDGGAVRKANPKRTGVYMALYLKMNNWPEDIRVLCWNCNASRGSFGYCPHEREREA